MRSGRTLGVVVGLALAGSAFGAGAQSSGQQQQRQQQQQQQRQMQGGQQSAKWQATKHLAVIHVALDSAEQNAEMLEKLAREPQAYDRDHGQVFLTNIDTSLAQAETHFGHLQPLAKTDAEKQQVNMLGDRIKSARQAAMPLKQDLASAQKVQQDAGRLKQALDRSQEPIDKIAKQMNVDIDVG